MKNKNEHGFSMVEGLVIATVIGLIGLVGLFVWHARHNNSKSTIIPTKSTVSNQKVTDKSTQTVAPSTTQQTPTNSKTNSIIAYRSATGVIKIPELGIQITVPAEIKDLTYVIEKQTDFRDKEVIYARLTTQALYSSYNGCDAENSSDGVLGRGVGQKPTETEAPFYYEGTYKQFTSFFITYEHSHAACPGLDINSTKFNTVSDLQLKQENLLTSAVSSIDSINVY